MMEQEPFHETHTFIPLCFLVGFILLFVFPIGGLILLGIGFVTWFLASMAE